MSKQSTRVTSKAIRITKEDIQSLWVNRNRSQDNDPDCAPAPPEAWPKAVVGKYFRPVKQQVTTRIDMDILDWLKSKGAGHLTRINAILREAKDRESFEQIERSVSADLSAIKARKRPVTPSAKAPKSLGRKPRSIESERR